MPKLIGLNWDERTAWEIEQKGWCEQVKLQMDDGTLVALSIYDPTRLRQEVEAEFASGKLFFAERNLIVVPQLTEKSILDAVEKLLSSGFFS